MAKGLRCVNCGAIEYLHLLPLAVLLSDYHDELLAERSGCPNTLLLCLEFENPPGPPTPPSLSLLGSAPKNSISQATIN